MANPSAPLNNQNDDFLCLIKKEAEKLGTPKDLIKSIKPSRSAHEPWVAFTPADYFGLALSGGGVRSATFNLGLLQALHKKGLLQHLNKEKKPECRVDYLSTVSGGGYIGAFWTRWRKLQKDNKANDLGTSPFATVGPAGQGNTTTLPESQEIRHLREYSRFLIPSAGLSTDFFQALIIVIQGVVPSFTAAFSLILFCVSFWAFLAYLAMQLSPLVLLLPDQISLFSWWLALQFGGILLLILILLSCLSQLSAFLKWIVPAAYTVLSILFGGYIWASFVNNLIKKGALLTGLGFVEGYKGEVRYFFNSQLSALCVGLSAMLVLILFARLIYRRFNRENSVRQSGAADDRTDWIMIWLLRIFIIWAVFSALWEIGLWLKVQAIALKSTGGVVAVLATLFVWLRSWVKKGLWKEGKIGWGDRLKPYIEVLLANGLVLSMFVFAVIFIQEHGLADGKHPTILMLLIPFAILVAVFVFFDPAKIGFHTFYRQKISECYLRAAGIGTKHPSGEPNPTDAQKPVPSNNGQGDGCRFNRERPYIPTADDKTEADHVPDDMLLKDACDVKPIHLICCAANHLYGDLKGTLYRGARSAVLSKNGIAIGNSFVQDESLYLSSAVTASAAATNSMMGDKNVALGAALAFVMTAFSVRLGLWVKNPERPCESSPIKFCQKICDYFCSYPGVLFFLELLGRGRTGEKTRYIHLSDGGHFENLGLYELIRRHCRYIIVSDAGMDKDFTFDDFGRAVRRVREDFGVEIEVDFEPLRPGPDGLSRRHVAVGSIHYDGLTGIDKGTIIYIKPVLTGDEPVDLFEYQCGNKAFPYDTTLDQFFDEAQWESYRRLGEHSGNASLCMLEDNAETKLTESLFRRIRMHWCDTPWTRGDAGIRLRVHREALEKEISEKTPALLNEFFGGLHRAAPSALHGYVAPILLTDETTDTETINPMIAHRVFSFMEEAWFVCQLDLYWAHPLASTWMAHLHRLAAMPSVQCWWPFLKAMYGEDFQKFAAERLGLPPKKWLPEYLEEYFKFEKSELTNEYVDGYALRRCRVLRPEVLKPEGHMPKIQYSMLLSNFVLPKGNIINFQVGFAMVYRHKQERYWNYSDLFVPPELRGGGLTTYLLDRLLDHLEKVENAEKIIIHFTNGKPGKETPFSPRGPAERQYIIELIDFYKSRGFRFERYDNRSERLQLVRP